MPELNFLLPITDQLPGYWRYRLPTTKLLPAPRINSQATDTTNWETKTLVMHAQIDTTRFHPDPAPDSNGTDYY
jgi:hypothetical protein